MKRTILWRILFLALCFSCEKDETPILEIDKSEIVLSPTHRQDTFTITSNQKWQLKAESLDYGIGIKPEGKFYILSQSFGEGDERISITLKDGLKGDEAVQEEILYVESSHQKVSLLLKAVKKAE